MENQLNSLNLPEPATVTPVDDDAAAQAESPAVLVIPRVLFNYVVIAVVFFILGAVVSALGSNALFNANSRENQALIQDAVKAVASAQGSTDTASAEPDPNKVYDVSADDDPFRGTENAQVVMIEFSDFNCGFCGRFAQETLNPLMEKYGDRVKFVYRDYPILAQSSLTAALAAQCAYEQGKFWDYHNVLFTNQGQFGREFFIQQASELGMDETAFTKCLDDQKYLDEIRNDAITAQTLGLRGTPAFFINGKYISGAQPYQVFADAIEAALQQAANPQGDSAS
ncbi:MAG: DsbA family protein [Chloroflexi bacterium]|nr:DsbA family protein [Chloroflexota bacterium]